MVKEPLRRCLSRLSQFRLRTLLLAIAVLAVGLRGYLLIRPVPVTTFSEQLLRDARDSGRPIVVQRLLLS